MRAVCVPFIRGSVTSRANLELNAAKHAARSAVVGHMWGDDTTPMLAALEASYSPLCDETYPGGFDAILVADCLYWAHLHRCVTTCHEQRSCLCSWRLTVQYTHLGADHCLKLAHDACGLMGAVGSSSLSNTITLLRTPFSPWPGTSSAFMYACDITLARRWHLLMI